MAAESLTSISSLRQICDAEGGDGSFDPVKTAEKTGR